MDKTIFGEDPHYKTEMDNKLKERYHKARNDKNIYNLFMTSGIDPRKLKDENALNEFIKRNDALMKSFDLSIEKKSYKDGFQNLFSPKSTTSLNFKSNTTMKGKYIIYL